ncbi:putative HTH-type transcriptional regulator YbaQ [Abditibacteriota bacterium]|nr:putative HTH-type transcriptional regulator YbaQ [Abditibacteriota bacterium]
MIRKKNMDMGVVRAEELLDFDGPLFVGGYEDEKGDFPAPSLEEQLSSPTHPGVILRDLYLSPTSTTLTDFAARIGVSRRSVSMIVNGSRPITVDMANRLSRALGTSAAFWLNLQREVDIWNALHKHRAEYERIEPLSPTA